MKNQVFHVDQPMINFDLLDPAEIVYHPKYLMLCERACALTDANCSLRLVSQLYDQKFCAMTQLLACSSTSVKNSIIFSTCQVIYPKRVEMIDYMRRILDFDV